jgi:predicted ester cyclase
MDSVTTQNKALLHNYHELIWNEHRLDAIDDFIAPEFTSHAIPPDAPKGSARSKEFLAMLFQAFPDLHSNEDILMGDGDKVAIHWTMRATHKGDLFGVKATDKPIVVSGMDILRVENGKFVEHWGGIGDQMPKIMKQIS